MLNEIFGYDEETAKRILGEININTDNNGEVI
jgi:hypothetical protein